MVNESSAALSIDVLEPAEVEAAVELWGETGLVRPWNDPRADIQRALASPSATVLAGRIDGALAATAMVGFDGHRAWIYYLAVRPSLKRRGFGAAMTRAAEVWAKARGAPKLNLMVRSDNKAVLGFYEALGYRVSETATLQRVLD